VYGGRTSPSLPGAAGRLPSAIQARQPSATGAPLIAGPPRARCSSTAVRVGSNRWHEGEWAWYRAGRVAVLVHRVVRGHSENQTQSRGGQHRRECTPRSGPRRAERARGSCSPMSARARDVECAEPEHVCFCSRKAPLARSRAARRHAPRAPHAPMRGRGRTRRQQARAARSARAMP
jgi:hypothetical protein